MVASTGYRSMVPIKPSLTGALACGGLVNLLWSLCFHMQSKEVCVCVNFDRFTGTQP